MLRSSKRTHDSTELILSDPARPSAHRRRALLDQVYTTPFDSHAVYDAHHSCVNALAISPGAGRWLASGGDDQRILIHDAFATSDEGVLAGPKAWYRGAQSNVFSVDFDCTSTKVYSAGNDAAILCHDLEAASATTLVSPAGPTQVWVDNDDSIHGIACHPSNPHLFLSASSDGTLRQYDTRTDTNAVGVIADAHEMEDVAFHPLQHDLFGFAGEDAHAGLVDTRMAWHDPSAATTGVGPARLSRGLARDVAVVTWHANLVRPATPPSAPARPNASPTPGTRRARPAVSSIAFAPDGSLVALTLSGHLPTLYTLSTGTPLATLSARSCSSASDALPPNFPATYRNTCTTKHGSFGGGPDAKAGQGLYFASGSDNFGVYVWEIPSRDTMQNSGRTESFEHGTWPEDETGTAYLVPSNELSPASLSFPHSIEDPSSVLRAHRSIPNTALFHPTLPYLYTCGVEKVIVRHSPSTTTSRNISGNSKGQFVARTPRAESAPSPSLLFGLADPALQDCPLEEETTEDRDKRLRKEDLEVLEYFDLLIQSESDPEGIWRDSVEGEDNESDDGAYSSQDSFGSDDDSDEDNDDERLHAAGDTGTVRRILNTLYALEGASSEEEDDENPENEGL
ncbi:WD40 repeat domain-containing protein [Sporobolomyces koalae]|uniref:WD40 repeat domain-containing protein n=1 Tax=Sporobolomyces koalae TaxID=500713 RepID=UPI00317C3F58